MRKRAYIWVNGIDTFPGDRKNWNGRAVTWTMLNRSPAFPGLLVAEMLEYFCGPVGAFFHQKQRGEALAEKIQAYQSAGFEVVPGGHSNGCKVVLEALALIEEPDFPELHLVSGACEADFEKNGLNTALSLKQVGNVFIYEGGQDRALRLAGTLGGHLLGFGTLGLVGPQNAAKAWFVGQTGGIGPGFARVQTTRWPTFGHSDCWLPFNFDATMRQLTRGAAPPVAPPLPPTQQQGTK